MRKTKNVRFSEEIVQKICERLRAGETFEAISSGPDMPAVKTVVWWRTRHPAFGDAVKAALRAAGRVERRVPAAEKWAFYEAALLYEGDDCLIWPFSTKGSRGYAAINPVSGKVIYISRLVCEAVHGPPPTDTHEAAHTCGRGKFGCVTRKHLAWKTVQQNNWDKDEHGTRIWGEKHPDVKLTVAKVIEIRARVAAGEKQADLLAEYGVVKSTMSSIVQRKTWKRVA